MKRFLARVGIILGTCSPVLAHAQIVSTPTIFDLFYDQVTEASPSVKPPQRIAQFVIDEMKHWGVSGIKITADDIDLAIAGLYSQDSNDGLCQSKVDMNDNPYTFEPGGALVPGSCLALQTDILALLTAELEAEQLGADLMTLASGSELSIADEPHRPLDMALYSLLLRRVWTGTGASVIPWDGSADSQVADLNATLSALDEEGLEEAVLRFHHGYFRDQRESDPRFSGVQDDVGTALQAIAAALSITINDAESIGIFATPKLTASNVALWARGDDIGLMWIYPTHAFRLELKPADDYPEFVVGGDNLAYPFMYTGGTPPTGAGIVSPLCSRMVGRQGYLCRPLPSTAQNCDTTGDGRSITLVECSVDVTRTKGGPSICPGFDNLFTDTGIPLEDPADPGHLNPALTKADYATICAPENKVIYQDDITSNACYVALCLLQSMSGHTLVPNRNPVVINEATSPYLACIRPDPQLGLYTEIAEDSPYPLPEYLGPLLVDDFARQYCAKNGDAPLPLMGLCVYNDNTNAALPITDSFLNVQVTERLGENLALRGDDFNSIAASIGQRASLDQAIELERKMFGKLAHFIQHIADLFMELRSAPLTQSACPWTGMFHSADSAP